MTKDKDKTFILPSDKITMDALKKEFGSDLCLELLCIKAWAKEIDIAVIQLEDLLKKKGPKL